MYTNMRFVAKNIDRPRRRCWLTRLSFRNNCTKVLSSNKICFLYKFSYTLKKRKKGRRAAKPKINKYFNMRDI